MTRLLVLLSLCLAGCAYAETYTVDVSPGLTRLSLNKGSGGSDVRFDCTKGNCDWIYDLAFALNEAHERRKSDKAERALNKIRFEMIAEDAASRVRQDEFDRKANPEKQIKRPRDEAGPEWLPKNSNSFDYKAACGQDDCGKESQ